MSHLVLLPATLRPAPRRTANIHLRLTPEERDRLIAQARAAQYQSISEYLRDLAAAARSAP